MKPANIANTQYRADYWMSFLNVRVSNNVWCAVICEVEHVVEVKVDKERWQISGALVDRIKLVARNS